ncbi:metal-dependent hydrolase [Halobium salinum]|uniref:Metal-dependent hydrolase n=1 Tax=Halobium salinum TaxID=1364940 RepID=A0ABD5PEH2_9EURY|nr:metal-dependent hydrolase [Halobium salinum]
MFVGHATAAFAVAAVAASMAGYSRERALAVALLAGVFAAIPDVDMSYALVGVAGTGLQPGDAGTMALARSFWQSGNVVHRAVTHSLVVAPVVALAAGAWVRGRNVDARRFRGTAWALLVGLVATAGFVSGPLGAAVMGLFGLAALGASEAAVHLTDFRPREVFAAALFGLVSHPFGDLFTGEPPAILYPLDVALVAERVALSADPTLHLLTAFGIELATLWAALFAYLALRGRRPRRVLEPRAALGVGYAVSVLLIPAPTLDLSYPFVFSVLAVGLVGAVPRVRRLGERLSVERPGAATAVVTGLAAVTVAWLAYAVAYLLA